MSFRSAPLLALLWSLFTCTALLAQVSTSHVDENGREIVTVRAFVSGGNQNRVGLGFACVDVENVDDKAHGVDIEFLGARSRGRDVRSARSLDLAAGESARFWLPIHMPPFLGRMRVVVGSNPLETSIGFPRNKGLIALYVTDRPDSKGDADEVLLGMPGSDPGNDDVVTCPSQDIPRDWRMFSAFPVVVVDGRANVDGERQDALRRYAFAGGTVVTVVSERLPVGPLREAMARLDRGGADYGLGALVDLQRLGGNTRLMRERLRPVRRTKGLPLSFDMFVQQEIKGLGRAPVGAFVFVIVLFAILVGPVNFWFLRKRKKPLLALVTVPLAGFGTTAVILLYGVLHDGFGVRGTVQSWTTVDQVRHEAVTIGAHTLFAGLAPSDLTMGADSMVLSVRAGVRGRQSDRWHWDADRERLDGGVLPSRIPTALCTVQQGTMRARLTVRRIDGDTMEVVHGGGIEPVGPMALCDLEGIYWTGTNGRLQRTGQRDGRDVFEKLRNDAGAVPVSDPFSETTSQIVPEMTPRTLIAPGTFAARVATAPWLDDHGVSVDYDTQRHYVFGRMSAEDFVQ